ncbi:hypothetical protein GCM10010320_67000 [Streptomyces caelestis]|nr:hypothetical protein GCM10010320_67000 [Streptomyces caelestis]
MTPSLTGFGTWSLHCPAPASSARRGQSTCSVGAGFLPAAREANDTRQRKGPGPASPEATSPISASDLDGNGHGAADPGAMPAPGARPTTHQTGDEVLRAGAALWGARRDSADRRV